jgi:hyaluronan synthase
MTFTQEAALSADGYKIPTARLRRRRVPVAMWLSLLIIVLWFTYRAGQDLLALHGHDHQALLWTVLMLAATHQTILAWLDRPFTMTARKREYLDKLPVTVNIPLFNESREIVDRVLYALFHQVRPPNRVDVVINGCTDGGANYEELRSFWEPKFKGRRIEFNWVLMAQKGKRTAQAWTFRSVRDGVVLTLDSDTVLERRAIEQILIPFYDRLVQSVAGVELARNQAVNVLTRINGMRQLVWQMVQCCALNVTGGNVLVNRGTFAGYRAKLLWETVDAYVAETFMGREVSYSDDSLLTLYALGRGKAVQQMSAFQFTEYHDNVSAITRQWIRWMRGSTIRSIWRARYLPVRSYGWWINLINWWQLPVSSAAYIYVFLYLPTHGRLSLSAFSAAIFSAYLSNVRSLLVARSDQSPLYQLDTFLLSPFSWLWSLLVLRPLRVYGMLTCANNDWGTRKKVEVGMDKHRKPIPGEVLASVTWTAPPDDPEDTHPNPLEPVPAFSLADTMRLPASTDTTVTTIPRVRSARHDHRYHLPPLPVVAAGFLVVAVTIGLAVIFTGRGPGLPTVPQVAQIAPPTLAATSAPRVVLPSMSPSTYSKAPVLVAAPITRSAKPGPSSHPASAASSAPATTPTTSPSTATALAIPTTPAPTVTNPPVITTTPPPPSPTP